MAETDETEREPARTVDEQRAERREELEAERAGQRRRTPPKHPEPTSFDAEPLTTPSGKRITVTDQEFAVMLERAGGFRSRLAKQLGISVSAVTHRIKRSKYLTDVCKTVEETVLDLAEAQLIKAAQNGEPWAITFILKCKGKKRGWVERQEIAIGGDPESLPPPIVLGVHDSAYIEAERERQKKEFAELAEAAVIELKPETAADGGENAGTWGVTAQPSDAGTGNGAAVAPTGGGTGAESPQTEPEAPVSRPAEREASSQGGGAKASTGAEIAPVAAEPQKAEVAKKPQQPHEPPKPETPPKHIPRTPSEARAMRLAEEARQRAENGNAGNGQGSGGGKPKPRFFAVPSAFPKR